MFVTISLEIQYAINKLNPYSAFYRLTSVDQQIRSYVSDVVR